jgi:hypothetical protein
MFATFSGNFIATPCNIDIQHEIMKLILTAIGYEGTVATLAGAEQVCSVQCLSGTHQMQDQLLGPDPPDSGTSTLPVNE